MPRLTSILAGLLALVSAPSAARAQPATAQSAMGQPAPRTVLFVGNSFTFGEAAGGPDLVRPFGATTVTDLNGTGIGGVPALFKRFTDEAGLRYSVALETAPGMGLDYHYNTKLALLDRPWNVVVLQSYSTLDAAHPGDPTTLVRYTAQLTDMLRTRNADLATYLVATWTRADQTYLPRGHWFGRPVEAMAEDVQKGYEAARARTPQIRGVIPVGAAWTRAIRTGFADANPYDGTDPGRIDLWAPDGYHASVYGYYLEALMIFGTVTGVDPQTLGDRETAAATLGIAPRQVAALQAIAHDQLRAARAP